MNALVVNSLHACQPNPDDDNYPPYAENAGKNPMNDYQLHMLTPSNENEYTNIMNIENIDQNIDWNDFEIVEIIDF